MNMNRAKAPQPRRNHPSGGCQWRIANLGHNPRFFFFLITCCMRDLILLFVHVVTVLIRLVRPGGVRAVLAESVSAQASIADSESFPTPRTESPHLGPAYHRMVRDTCAAETIGTIRNRGETIVASQLSSRSGSSKIPASVFRKTQNEAGTGRPKRGSDSCRC